MHRFTKVCSGTNQRGTLTSLALVLALTVIRNMLNMLSDTLKFCSWR